MSAIAIDANANTNAITTIAQNLDKNLVIGTNPDIGGSPSLDGKPNIKTDR